MLPYLEHFIKYEKLGKPKEGYEELKKIILEDGQLDDKDFSA